ncbi:MAG: CsbD family protein [Chloroflexi bacterium]|nr:MAG: CsbD family protein [Chloroflexota bacterium]TMG04725.1 MAG: CsbD family protein [Chloroflexota bacterium]
MADLRTEGKFDRIKGRARVIWGNLTDDDFAKARGSTEDLIGRIKEKTGETSEEISRKLDDLFAEEEGRGMQETRETGREDR